MSIRPLQAFFILQFLAFRCQWYIFCTHFVFKKKKLQLCIAVHNTVQLHSLSNPNQWRIALKCKAISRVGDYFMILIQNPLKWMEMYCTRGCTVSTSLVLHSFILTSSAALCKTTRWSSKSFCRTSSWFAHLWTEVITLEIGMRRQQFHRWLKSLINGISIVFPVS